MSWVVKVRHIYGSNLDDMFANSTEVKEAIVLFKQNAPALQPLPKLSTIERLAETLFADIFQAGRVYSIGNDMFNVVESDAEPCITPLELVEALHMCSSDLLSEDLYLQSTTVYDSLLQSINNNETTTQNLKYEKKQQRNQRTQHNLTQHNSTKKRNNDTN